MTELMEKGIPVLEAYLESLATINPSWYSQGIPEEQLKCTFPNIMNVDYEGRKIADIQNFESCGKPILTPVPKPPTQNNLKIEYNPTCGRYLIALRDIAAGEVIFQERPLVLAPKIESGITCLACLKLLKEEFDGCHGCGGPVCSNYCSGKLHSTEECACIAKLGLNDKKDTSIIRMLNVCLAPLRTILISQANATAREVVANLQSNSEMVQKFSVRRFVENQVMGLYPQMGLKIDKDVLQHIYGVFDINSYEVTLGKENRGRGLFMLASLVNHTCLPNTQHWYRDGVMTVRAVRNISAGESITTTYVSTLLGTKSRISHLLATKYFKCACERCSDPTELGSNISSVLCQTCESGQMGLFVPPTDSEDNWICNKCGLSQSQSKINTMVKAISSTISRLPADDIHALSSALNHFSKLLGSNNFIIMELNYALMKAIMQQPLKDITDDELKKVIVLADILLKIACFIDPGLSRFRGLLLLEKLRAATELLLRLGKIDPNNVNCDEISDVSVPYSEIYLGNMELLLNDASECGCILQYDPKLEEYKNTIKVLQPLTSKCTNKI